MEPTTLARYGLLLVFLSVLLDQGGLPVPSLPILLACGALAAKGDISLPLLLLASTLASLVADSVWYALGRWRGPQVLKIFCRVSLHADEIISNMERSLRHHGVFSIALAKFVPGIATIAPPLAGALGVSLGRFLVVSSFTGLAWAAGLLGVGWLFRDTIAEATQWIEALGVWALVLLGMLLTCYVAYVWRKKRKAAARERGRAPEPLSGEPVDVPSEAS